MRDDDFTLDHSGQSYQAQVPDTLDLVDNARLAVNGIGGILDPDLGFLPFHLAHWSSNTPHLQHCASADIGCGAKLCESFPLMRIMSGSRDYLDEEAGMRAAFLARIQDGLFWDYDDPARPWRSVYGDSQQRYGEGRREDFCIPAHAARMLRAVLVWQQLTGLPELARIARELVAGLRRIAISRDDYCYYPEKGGWGEATTFPRSGWIDTAEARDETEGPEGSITFYQGTPLYAAAQWYSLSGDPVALELAAGLAAYCMKQRFWGGRPDPDAAQARARSLPASIAARLPDPAYTPGAQLGHWHSHFHARAAALRGLLAYGTAAQDERVLEFVCRAYEFTLSQGIPRVGWINCFPGAINQMEGCALGDLVALGIRLTDAGLGDYWDDVDAAARNHLVEQQVTRPDLLAAIAAACEEDECRKASHPRQTTWDRVIPRTIGIYAGLSLPSGIPRPWSMSCCTGNATQGLYYVWEGIVRESGEAAEVNLLLNRVSKLVDIDSYLPYEGKVVIRNRAAHRVSLRIPFWVNRQEIRADVSGSPAPLDWLGNRLLFSRLRPQDTITVRFPVGETTAAYAVNANTQEERIYTCTFRAGTLVDISPRDEGPTTYPLYQRDHLRHDRAPLKTVERFLADRAVAHW